MLSRRDREVEVAAGDKINTAWYFWLVWMETTCSNCDFSMMGQGLQLKNTQSIRFYHALGLTA